MFPDLTLRRGASSERRLIHVNSSLHKGVIGATFSDLHLELFKSRWSNRSRNPENGRRLSPRTRPLEDQIENAFFYAQPPLGALRYSVEET